MFTARVRGRSIATVKYAVDGRRVKTVRRANGAGDFAVRINSARYDEGAHRLTARVTFRAGSGTRARTLTARFLRCQQAVLPSFTG
jgi:hypothetical protein